MWLVKDSLEQRWGLVWSKLEGTEHFIGLEIWGRRDIEDPMPGVRVCGRGDKGDLIAWVGGFCFVILRNFLTW